MALVITRREWECAIFRIDPATRKNLQEILQRVRDNAQMVSVLEALIALKGEVMVTQARSFQAKLSFKDFPLFVKIYRKEIDEKIKSEEKYNTS